jgi:hypothetical protein
MLLLGSAILDSIGTTLADFRLKLVEKRINKMSTS